MTRWRIAYLVGGWIMLGLGAAGVVLPLLPTAPFVLAAAWMFSRSSPAMAAWLLEHPVLGRPLRAWQEGGAISLRSKLLAIGSMAVGYAVALRFQPTGLVTTATAAILLAVAMFILTRPTPRMAMSRNCPERPSLRKSRP